MSDIFISYKREEQPLARKLADLLERKGWSVWWDPQVRAGERIDDVIQKALKDAKCVIVIWSRLSVDSRYVKDEANYALKRNKLIPVAIENVDLPFRFEGIQTGRLIEWEGSDTCPEVQKLVADVVSMLGKPQIGVKQQDLLIESRTKRKVEIEQNGTFTMHDTGVVSDAKSGLEWVSGPDRGMTWNEAKSWVETLTIDGGGWRLPTRGELKTLYKVGSGTRNMTPLLKTTGWWLWSAEKKASSSAWRYGFGRGERDWRSRDGSMSAHAFAVRSCR